MNREYFDLIDNYKKDITLNNSIRIYILNHLYVENDIISYIELFEKTANEIHDDVGIALANAMYFWVYHSNNIELAHDYNKKALDLYRKINDYQNKTGYLSALNNEIIYNNYCGIFHKSYELVNEGMTIAELNKSINYYFAFSVNCFYLLVDICLFDKAYEILNKLESNDVTFTPSNVAIMKTLLVKVNYNLGNYDECVKIAFELKEYNDEHGILEEYVIHSYILEGLIKLNDPRASSYVDLILNDINENTTITDKIDINEAYLALARYYKAKGDKENAFKWYKEVYLRYKNLLGCKLNALNEALDVFKDQDNDLYVKALVDKEKHLEEINRTLIVVSNQDKKIYDAFADFRYKFLYQKMKKLTSFIKELNNINDVNYIDKVNELIVLSLKDILKAKFVEVHIEDNDFVYKGLDFSSIEGFKIYENDDLPLELKKVCTYLTCIKIHDVNETAYLYIVVGLPIMGTLEKKENDYMISLIKEVLTPVLLQIERYKQALNNYSHDQLTTLYNRYGLSYILQENFKKSSSLYLLMIDIDNFKKINDAYGHDEGDKVLKAVADTLSFCLGKGNVSRIGGEEFIGLVDASNSSITFILDSLMNKIRNIKVHDQNVTISIGASIMTSIDEFDEAKIDADKKLYIAKQNGKNHYVL